MQFVEQIGSSLTFQVIEYPTLDGCIMNAVATGKSIKTPLKNLAHDYEKIIVNHFDLGTEDGIPFAIIYNLTQFPFISAEKKICHQLSTDSYWEHYSNNYVLMVAVNDHLSFSQPFTIRCVYV